MCWRIADTVYFMHAEQLQRQSPALWESGSLIYASIHLLSRIWAGWVTIAGKQTLARGYSGVIQMYTCKDGGQPSHAEFFLWTLHTGSGFLWSSLCMQLSIVPLRCHRFITDTSVTEEAGSLSLGTLPPTARPTPLCLLGWLAKSWRIVCRCAWREASPLCPGRTCGLGVFTLALFQAVFPHSMLASVSPGWQCSNPPSTKGGILRLRWHQQSCLFTLWTNRRD